MPAYNAAQTLHKTGEEVMDQEIVDLVIVVDDGSSDETVSIAKEMPDTLVHIHERNLGYGDNQKHAISSLLKLGFYCSSKVNLNKLVYFSQRRFKSIRVFLKHVQTLMF